MTSITTQTLASAIAQVAPNSAPQAQAKENHQIPTPGQMAQVSQAASEKQSSSLNRRDETRSPKVPKRTEGAFASQKEKARSGRSAKTEEKEEKTSNPNDGMDIVA